MVVLDLGSLIGENARELNPLWAFFSIFDPVLILTLWLLISCYFLLLLMTLLYYLFWLCLNLTFSILEVPTTLLNIKYFSINITLHRRFHWGNSNSDSNFSRTSSHCSSGQSTASRSPLWVTCKEHSHQSSIWGCLAVACWLAKGIPKGILSL